MEPVRFTVYAGRDIIIVAEADTYQLFNASSEWEKSRLADFRHYIGLLSIDPMSGEVYFTPGNDTLSMMDIEAVVGFIRGRAA